MKFHVIGQEVSAGEFTPSNSTNSIKFNNVLLYVSEIEKGIENGSGFRTSKIKIKSSRFDELMSKYVGKLVPFSLTGHQIDVYYDQYGQVSKIDIIK